MPHKLKMEPTEELIGQPQYGLPEPETLEQTRYLSENTVFVKDESKEKDDPAAVVAGDLPADMKVYFWSYLSKDMVLTYIRNDGDIKRMMDMLEETILSYQMSLPPGEFTEKTMRHLDNLRHMVYAKILRAMRGFERRHQRMSISQSYYGQSRDPSIQEQKPGLLNRFGFRR